MQLTGQPVPQVGFGSRIVEGPGAGLYLLEFIDQLHRDLGSQSTQQLLWMVKNP